MKIRKQASASALMRRLVLGGLLLALICFVWRRWLRLWGTESDEAQATLPSDAYISDPTRQMTLASDLPLPPTQVWPWLAQMGRAGVGFYTFDRLTNRGIPGAGVLQQNIDPLRLGQKLDNGLTIMAFEAPQTLVMGGFRLWGKPYDITYTYSLRPLPDQRCRLVLRLRLRSYGLWRLLFENFLSFYLVVQSINQFNALGLRLQASQPTLSLNHMRAYEALEGDISA